LNARIIFRRPLASPFARANDACMTQSMTDWRRLHGDSFRGRRVLVTGGAGFIGSHLAMALNELGATVIVIDDLSGGGDPADLPAAVTFVRGSILDTELLAKLTAGCDLVFHQAALGSVPLSVQQPRRFHEVNITGTFNVLEAANNNRVHRVMFAASSSAYGDSETVPKIETMPPRARSPYAATKAAGEALLSAFAACYPVDTVSLRYFNIFGPRQNANSAYAAVIAAFASAMLAGKAPVIYGDGEQSRDFTYVDNAVHANLLAGAYPGRLDGVVLNVAIGQRTSVNELARDAADILHRPDLKPVYQPPRAGDVRHSLADLSLTQKTLGYKPLVEFRPGLERTLAWYGAARETGSVESRK
jgi:nucleoside-diphosphate-sugar epimerase